MRLIKRSFLILLLLVTSLTGCSILDNSNNEGYYESQTAQNDSEQIIREHIMFNYDSLGIYEDYLFTKRSKYLTTYHKRLNYLYERKYQFDKDGVIKSDSLEKVNHEIDTLKKFIDPKNYKNLYKVEHDFGFNSEGEILLLRGQFFLTPKNKVDSLSIIFSSRIPDSLEKAYKHFIYRKAYEYHPYYEMSSGEYNFYENFHKELWNRRNMGTVEESEFLDHCLLLMDNMIKIEEFDSDNISQLKINNYLKSNALYEKTKDVKFNDLYEIETDNKMGVRRKIYEREINFYYLLGENWIKETLLFQFNEYFEIIN